MKSHRLHRSDCHDLIPRGVVCFKHGVEDALEKADFFCCMNGRKLDYRITARIDERIDAFSGCLVIGAAYFEVEWRDTSVGRCNVGIQISFCDVLRYSLPPF